MILNLILQNGKLRYNGEILYKVRFEEEKIWFDLIVKVDTILEISDGGEHGTYNEAEFEIKKSYIQIKNKKIDLELTDEEKDFLRYNILTFEMPEFYLEDIKYDNENLFEKIKQKLKEIKD
jgi:hypothetical protein